jgi:hypothetical protein
MPSPLPVVIFSVHGVAPRVLGVTNRVAVAIFGNGPGLADLDITGGFIPGFEPGGVGGSGADSPDPSEILT